MKSSIFAIILILTSLLTAQEKTLFTANLGLVQHAGTGYGLNFSTVQFIKDRLAVSFSGGFYKWNNGKDTQGPRNYNRNRKIINYTLIPFSIGGRYYFGNKNINPYFGLEWGLNVRKKIFNFEYSDFSDPDNPIITKWSEFSTNPFASFGLEFGVMIGIMENLSASANMKSIWGDGVAFTFFNTGLVYGI